MTVRDTSAAERWQEMFPEGQRVALTNLQSSPRLNGQSGKVLRWHTGKQRFEVQLPETSYSLGGTKFIKPLNLVPIEDTPAGPRCGVCECPEWQAGLVRAGALGTVYRGFREGLCCICYDISHSRPDQSEIFQKHHEHDLANAFQDIRRTKAAKLNSCAKLYEEACTLLQQDQSPAAQVKAFGKHWEAQTIDRTYGEEFPDLRLKFPSEAAREANAQAVQTHLSGDIGLIEMCIDEMKKVNVRLDLEDGSDQSEDSEDSGDERLSPGSGGFAAGERVKIQGLASAKEHNGKVGTLQRYKEQKGCWSVEVRERRKPRHLDLKPENLISLSTGVLPVPGSAATGQADRGADEKKEQQKEQQKQEKPEEKLTLIIEGMNIISAEDNFMTESILQGYERPKRKSVTRVNFHYGERADAVRTCQQELLSGVYSSVIVSDLSCEFEAFQQQLGVYLQAFVRLGGAVAFLSGEGGQLQSTLQALFQTIWTPASYFRSTWGVAAENTAAVTKRFGDSSSFSVKASTVRNVPVSERCFGTTPTSRHESLSMRMMKGGAVPVGRGGPQDPGDNPDVPIDPDYDIVVAVHQYHSGEIAWFGDVNCEIETVHQVVRFCERCGPAKPVDMSSFSSLSASEFDSVVALKATGNDAFKQGNFAGATASYAAALAVYGSRAGSEPDQRKERVNLSSNTAECLIRQKMFPQAVDAASEALSNDSTNAKARIRRVKALAAIGGAERLNDAWGDLKILHSAGENSEVIAKLTKQVRAKRQAANSREAGGLRGAFAAGTSGLSGSSDENENRPKASWANGLKPPDLYEWFSNCYQMRCDDNYVFQGDLGGPYDPDADGQSIALDFLVFCLLAARNKAVPANWDWAVSDFCICPCDFHSTMWNLPRRFLHFVKE